MVTNKIFLLDVSDFLDNIKDNSIDLIIADPPYNIGIDKWDIFKNENEYFQWMYKWIDKAKSKLKKGGSFYLFNNQYNSAILLSHLRKTLVFNNWITWYKKDGFHPTKKKYVNNQETILFLSKNKIKTFNYDDIRIPYLSANRFKNKIRGKNGNIWFPNKKGKLCTDVWEHVSERHNNKINGKTIKLIHPTTKPSKLIEKIILASSSEGDTILDLFSGSGQTTYVARKLKRNSYGCELNNVYFNYINKRLCNP